MACFPCLQEIPPAARAAARSAAGGGSMQSRVVKAILEPVILALSLISRTKRVHNFVSTYIRYCGVSPRPKLVARTLCRPLLCSDGKLDVPSDSMGCLDNISHRKPNKYDTYKYRKFGTAELVLYPLHLLPGYAP